ncbi:MAG: hypothetical protein CMF52_08905 [Legionellales bacterium]|nr:hypothetical protein [Legionellales bacterium]
MTTDDDNKYRHSLSEQEGNEAERQMGILQQLEKRLAILIEGATRIGFVNTETEQPAYLSVAERLTRLTGTITMLEQFMSFDVAIDPAHVSHAQHHRITSNQLAPTDVSTASPQATRAEKRNSDIDDMSPLDPEAVIEAEVRAAWR